MRNLISALLFSLLFVTAAAAQDNPCDPEKKADCRRLDAIAFYSTHDAGVAPAKAVDAITTELKKDVQDANRATTTPSTFAARVHNSYEDFLNLLSFGINKVDESKDGRALTVRFNPLSDGQFLLGTSLTASQPAVADSVKKNIGESDRDAVVTKLEAAMGDTDDLTWAVAASLQTTRCTAASERCYGRSPTIYRDLLSPMMLAGFPDPDFLQSTLNSQLTNLLPRPNAPGQPRGEGPLSEASDPALARDLARRIAAAENRSVIVTRALFTDRHFDLLPALLDNQPQASLSLTYHSTGKYSGPADRGASFELQFGRQNLNTLHAACRNESLIGKCFLDQLAAYAAGGMLTDKVVLTASWKHTDGYNLDSLAPVSTVVLTPLSLPRATEYRAKAQYGRQISGEGSVKATRIDGSAEFVRNSSGSDRTLNRLVASLTLSVPYGDHITIPVTISYANKPEFLGDVKDRIGAHVGLSYRLPDLFGAK